MENMRKMVLFVSCGVGTKSATAYLIPPDMTEDSLADYAWECACQHADAYGIEVRDESDDNISGYFIDYDAKKHNGELIFGYNNTFQWNEL